MAHISALSFFQLVRYCYYSSNSSSNVHLTSIVKKDLVNCFAKIFSNGNSCDPSLKIGWHHQRAFTVKVKRNNDFDFILFYSYTQCEMASFSQLWQTVHVEKQYMYGNILDCISSFRKYSTVTNSYTMLLQTIECVTDLRVRSLKMWPFLRVQRHKMGRQDGYGEALYQDGYMGGIRMEDVVVVVERKGWHIKNDTEGKQSISMTGKYSYNCLFGYNFHHVRLWKVNEQWSCMNSSKG